MLKALSTILSLVADNISVTEAVCPHCNNKFDYDIPEAGMGYVNCPKCEKPVHQGCILKKGEEASKLEGFVTDIEKDTADNTNFRKVIYTSKNFQLVLMSLKPKEEIGLETHKDVDQFFRIEKGTGVAIINGKEHKIKNGYAIMIPQGAEHNIIAGNEGLKIYTIYSPPHHFYRTLQKSKEDALKNTREHFDGQTTEK